MQKKLLIAHRTFREFYFRKKKFGDPIKKFFSIKNKKYNGKNAFSRILGSKEEFFRVAIQIEVE